MRAINERQKVYNFYKRGLNKTEISKITNIPRTTINDWLNKPINNKKNNNEINPEKYLIDNKLENIYSYILGLYLGDGYINKMPRTWKLRIFLDSQYINLNELIKYNLQKLFPNNKVTKYKHSKNNMEIIYVYSNILPRLFPQHGKGLKHTRKIKLMDWQNKIINSKYLIMGLFHSDGSYYPRSNKKTGKKYYAYDFKNQSDDLHNIFKKHCENMDVFCSFSTKPKTTHIYKKEYVQKMFNLIGSKKIIKEINYEKN